MIDKIVECLTNPDHIGVFATIAAAVSAFAALLTYISSKKLSRRDRVDILKVEILKVVSSSNTREHWNRLVQMSTNSDSDGKTGPRADRLASLLGVVGDRNFMWKFKNWGKIKSKYERNKWVWLIPVAIEELKREGYQDLLGL